MRVQGAGFRVQEKIIRNRRTAQGSRGTEKKDTDAECRAQCEQPS